ncbi:MAG: AAA family ATPase [Candidatus Thorarchaeota archaeon]|jgi:RecA/RadA recombinase
MRYTELEVVRGVGPTAAKKLREVHIPCAELLAMISADDLQMRTKLGEGTCEKITKNARRLFGMDTPKAGILKEQELGKLARLSTGVAELDRALLGGIETGSMVEFYGQSRGGKSLWCSQLAVTCQLPTDRGGLGRRVLWLDSEMSFKPLVVRANAFRMGLDPDETLEGILVQSISHDDHLREVLIQIPKIVMEQDIGLIIVDSLGGLFQVEYSSLGQREFRLRDLLEVLESLRTIAVAMGCVVVYTNQVFHKLRTYLSNPNAPMGGNVMAHASTHLFYTRRIKGGQRRIQLLHNAGLPPFELDVYIGWGGFYRSHREQKLTGLDIAEYLEPFLRERDEEIERFLKTVERERGLAG